MGTSVKVTIMLVLIGLRLYVLKSVYYSWRLAMDVHLIEQIGQMRPDIKDDLEGQMLLGVACGSKIK